MEHIVNGNLITKTTIRTIVKQLENNTTYRKAGVLFVKVGEEMNSMIANAWYPFVNQCGGAVASRFTVDMFAAVPEAKEDPFYDILFGNSDECTVIMILDKLIDDSDTTAIAQFIIAHELGHLAYGDKMDDVVPGTHEDYLRERRTDAWAISVLGTNEGAREFLSTIVKELQSAEVQALAMVNGLNMEMLNIGIEHLNDRILMA